MTASDNDKAGDLETYYTVTEIATKWKLSDDTVRNLFAGEPGVLRIGQASRLVSRRKGYKRHYFVLRISESALRRVEQRLMDKRPAEPAGRPEILDGGRDRHAG
jgi:hypothetical protein